MTDRIFTPEVERVGQTFENWRRELSVVRARHREELDNLNALYLTAMRAGCADVKAAGGRPNAVANRTGMRNWRIIQEWFAS